jgi:hypothetical protein
MICLYLSADVSLLFQAVEPGMPVGESEACEAVRRTDCGNTCHLAPKLYVYLSEHLVEDIP